MGGDAWRIPGHEYVAWPWFDNLGTRGAKADQAPSHETGDDRQSNSEFL